MSPERAALERQADELDELAWYAADEDNAAKAKRLRAKAAKLRAKAVTL
jgi:hypothetical protein